MMVTRKITKAEMDIIVLIVEDLEYPQIAEALGLALPTVKAHIHHIFAKTGIANREALKQQFLRGWLDDYLP